MSKKYVVRWKDFNSPLTRNEIWASFPNLWLKLFKMPKAIFGIYSEKNSISYFADLEKVEKIQEKLARKIIANPNELEGLMDLSEKWGSELNAYTETIYKADLSKWPAKKLISAYKKYFKLQQRQYTIGVFLVVLDVSLGPKSLDSIIKNILSKELTEDSFSEAYSAFTTPLRDSFTRQQDKDLLKIYKKFYAKKNIVKTLKSQSIEKSLEVIRESSPLFYKELQRHVAKWAWIYYVFMGPAWIESDFIGVIKDWIIRDIKPEILFKSWEQEQKQTKMVQKKYLGLLSISNKEKKLLQLAGQFVWSKPRRKDYQTKSYWHMERFFQELATRLKISVNEARSMSLDMIFSSLVTNKVSINKIRDLYNCHLTMTGPSKSIVLSGDRAKKFKQNIYEEKFDISGSEFSGSPACRGKVRGIVKIINCPEDMHKMEDDNVLVSVATSPSIVSVMRKAAAILTDEGGLTCHAAIVSRELKIPCIVGLKIITQALKDGDMVEVDASNGIVKKINK